MVNEELKGVSLADALRSAPTEWVRNPNQPSSEYLADVVFAWFRANRDTLVAAFLGESLDQLAFDALLDTATKIGQP